RPYFLLKTADGGRTRVAERLLPLQGGRNFRDIGGYRTADGRQVRWGRIYRSGGMSELTAADIRYLLGLGVGVVCDLRSQQERASEPSPLAKADVRVIATDYDMETLMGQRRRPATVAEYVNDMADGYVGMTSRLSTQYSDMFDRLVRGEAPLAFNCSGGKDRTGVGAAIILSVLGVPRATVLYDYGLTGVYLPEAEIRRQLAAGGSKIGLTPERARSLLDVPDEVRAVMFSSDPRVMAEALGRIDRSYGDPIELAKAKFGLDDAKVLRLRELYLN
ncbi:MAG TPA: tyrosine-protein phosphatase, partial [Caulobacteraceae bacterium]|nr:tyrosine-protein phosphatase [Caulobacteraceae bacterium]